jgi:hypothetical protein
MKRSQLTLALLTYLCGAATYLYETPAQALRGQSGSYELEVLVGGAPAPTFSHAGETYVLGQRGERYTLRIWNRSGRRVEAVVTVDGRDVVDGRPGDYQRKRGYVVPAYSHIDIDGWRLSAGQAAAFRFSSVARSYAARTGSARDVGVIGVAVFPERYVPPRPVYIPRPRPMQPRDDYDAYGDARPRREAQAEKSAPEPSAGAMAPPPEGRAKKGDAGGYRPGLGTAFGEAVDSPVYETEFVRHNPGHPDVVLGLRYNDREGLLAMGVDVDGRRYPWPWNDTYVRRTAEPFPVNRQYATPPPGWEY